MKTFSGLFGIARFQINANPSEDNSPFLGAKEFDGVSSGETTLTAEDPIGCPKLFVEEVM